ncbi:hypothetical protein C1N60_23165 (plasmid) [Pantoea sp. SGAir0184]
MCKLLKAINNTGVIIYPVMFYYAFLMVISLAMRSSLLPADFIFIRFHFLLSVLLVFCLWAGRDKKHAALASIAGVLAPLVIMAVWFLLKAFVLYSQIEWTPESFREAISFSGLFGVLSPILFINSANLKFGKK